MDPRSLDPDVDPNTGSSISNTASVQRKSSMISNLQPRAAATIDFNEDSDEEDGGLLSADYKAQKKTTQDLIDFFKSAPPPSPPRMPPIEEEKKKRSLLQRLRPRKSGSSLSNGAGGNGSSVSMGNGNRRSSVLIPPGGGTSSNISSISGVTTGKGKNGEDITTATLPNGRKYIMIAVDYKEGEGGATAPGATALASATGSISSRRQSRIPDDIDGSMLGGSKTTSLMGKNILAESAMGIHGGGGDRRRSVIPQSGNGEASKFVLENGPFLLDDFAIESDFIAQDGDAASKTTSETGAGLSRTNSKRGNKVKFSINGDQIGPDGSSPMNEAVVTEALSQRIASHKARQQHQTSNNEAVDSNTSTHHDKDFLDIILPKPVSRKKVRHVQIQTQHCVMRPMHTQTEPYESLVQDTEVKDWSTQTNGSASGSTEVGSSTFDEGSAASSKDATTATTATSTSPITTTPSTAFPPVQDGTTTTNSDAPGQDTISMQQELAQLRQQNAQLQSQMTSLQRDLAAETRARTRTAVAMQDTRDKFEMLSAVAYKKLKEMIFQRHVLEMEVRELRAQVDLQSEVNVVQQGEMLFRQEQQMRQLQQQQAA